VSTTPNANDKIVHVYDDIEEEDNHLPNWWLAILFGTILFGFGYWIVFHSGHYLSGPREQYADDVALLNAKLALANPTSEEAMLALSKDPTAIEAGKKIFTTTCVACHGPEGAGLVGPNLTDKFWLHGNKATQILETVKKGYPEKGMPTWGKVIGDEGARNVTAFVLTLKGKNLPGKAPQGDPLE
jgi:cytochrome c oxidase cbb3-type subunit 3